jgi:hypothetical protein
MLMTIVIEFRLRYVRPRFVSLLIAAIERFTRTFYYEANIITIF